MEKYCHCFYERGSLSAGMFLLPWGISQTSFSSNGACVDGHKLQKRQCQFPFALATSLLILGSVGPTKSLPTVCHTHTHTHLVHQRSRVTANTRGKTKNTRPMGDSLAAPSFQKCSFSPSWPQDIVPVCIPLRRAKCGTSTSFLAVLKGSPVALSRPAWDACKGYQC